jgi:prepilin-type N-terminal cleavage/methylation domain-containing protein
MLFTELTEMGIGKRLMEKKSKKSGHEPKRKGFTLIELLVVIAVITVIGAIAIPVTSLVIEKAKGVQCIAQIRDLSAALEAYRLEYGHLPQWYVKNRRGDMVPNLGETWRNLPMVTSHNTGPGRHGGDLVPRPPWTASSQFLRCLMGLPNTWTNWNFENERGARFFEPQVAPDGFGGLYEVAGEYAYNDPWGRGFTIMMDLNKDGKIFIDGRYAGRRWWWAGWDYRSEGHVANGTHRYIIMSKGKDVSDSSDNIYSWR